MVCGGELEVGELEGRRGARSSKHGKADDKEGAVLAETRPVLGDISMRVRELPTMSVEYTRGSKGLSLG